MTEEFDAGQTGTEQDGVQQDGTEQIDAELDGTEEAETHEVTVAIAHVNAPQMYNSVSSVYEGDMGAVKPLLPRVYEGCDIALQVSVSCSLGCDLQGAMVEVSAEGGVLAQAQLCPLGEGDDADAANKTDVITLAAPTEPGEYTWTAAFEPLEAQEEGEDTPHAPASAAFAFVVEAHMISLSSWDLPFPVTTGSKLAFKAGARCVGNCDLAGEQIELYDQEGTLLAAGTLGEEPYRDTVGTYWTELELDAPVEAGVYEWELRFSQPDRPLAHDDASHAIVFRAARPPEHLLTVELISDWKKVPVVGALVAVSSGGVSYRAQSDEAGKVTFNVPKGDYRLYATADDHAALAPEDAITVDGDQAVSREMVYAYDSYK